MNVNYWFKNISKDSFCLKILFGLLESTSCYFWDYVVWAIWGWRY